MFRNKSILSTFSLLAALTFGSCSKDSDSGSGTGNESDSATYSFVVSAGTPAGYYILQAKDLSTGSISTSGNGVEISYGTFTARNGYYYEYNSDASSIVKYTSTNSVRTVVKETPLSQISWAAYSSFYAWKDDQTLVLFSCNGGLQFEYATLNVETMAITASGNINIPAAVNGTSYYWGNNVVFVGSKLYISYAKFDQTTDATEGKTYVASMDFPNVTNVTIDEDTRSYYVSPYNLNTPGAVAYNGTAYFLNSNTVWSAGNTNSPTGILRVQNGGTAIDDSYFYNFVDNVTEEAIGLFSLGNGKAIVKVWDKSKLKAYTDYNAAYGATYYVVDLVNQTKTKLDIAASIGSSYNDNVLVDNGYAYIVTNTGDGYYVYNYNISTGVVTKGLKLDGINALERIDRIK
jgi:hypothetical protein